jgi:stage II sporulation protein D
LLVAATAQPVSPGADEARVRVLLLEERRPVPIASLSNWGPAPRRVAPGPGGVWVDGQRVGSRLRLPGPGPHRVRERRYRGAIEARLEDEYLQVVNELALESYVAGTLLGEVYESWGGAVLRAQAVASRTYALHRRARAREEAFDLEAGTAGQMYLGLDGESADGWSAVQATQGEYLAWEGEPILAAFHSSSGGRTASADEVWGEAVPYLVSLPVDGEEESPDTYWRASLSAERLEHLLVELGRPVGRVVDLRVIERSRSGRVRWLRVKGTERSEVVEGRDLRRELGRSLVRSTLFAVRRQPQGFVLVGSGRGHGVGMSQWGARAMARSGAGYRDILARFYPGATLERLAGSPTAEGHGQRGPGVEGAP